MSVIAPAVVLFGCIALLIYLMYRKVNFGGGCCGEHEAPAKRVRPKDSNISHYPFRYTAKIGGMVCSHCVRNVENKFNSADGIYAKVHLENKSAAVYSKHIITRNDAVKILDGTAYTILGFEEDIK